MEFKRKILLALRMSGKTNYLKAIEANDLSQYKYFDLSRGLKLAPIVTISQPNVLFDELNLTTSGIIGLYDIFYSLRSSGTEHGRLGDIFILTTPPRYLTIQEAYLLMDGTVKEIEEYLESKEVDYFMRHLLGLKTVRGFDIAIEKECISARPYNPDGTEPVDRNRANYLTAEDPFLLLPEKAVVDFLEGHPGRPTVCGKPVPEWATDEIVDFMDNLYWVINYKLDERKFPARDLEFTFVESDPNYIATFIVEKDFVIKVCPDFKLVYAYSLGKETNIINGLDIDQLDKIMV